MLILIHYQLFEFETFHYELSCKMGVHAKFKLFFLKETRNILNSWLHATKVAISLAQNIANPFLFSAEQSFYRNVLLNWHKQSFLAIAIAHLRYAQNPATAAAKNRL